MSEKLKAHELAQRPLWDLTREYDELLDALEEAAEANEGVLPDELDERFNALEGATHQKVERCGFVIGTLQNHVDRVKAEEERLRSLRKRSEANVDRLKEYVRRNMARIGLKKTEGDYIKVRRQSSGFSVEVLDEGFVPDEFCDVEVKMSAKDFAQLMKAAYVAFSPEHIDRLWTSTRTVRKKAVTDYYKKLPEEQQAEPDKILGLRVTKGEHIVIW